MPIETNSIHKQNFEKTKKVLFNLVFQTIRLLESINQELEFPRLNLFKSIEESIDYCEKLKTRIQDKRSRVLVTGDVNAGKSTFVNTLLRRQVVPDDQEPCTCMFVEVIDSAQNNGIEQVHAVIDQDYDPADDKTFKILPLAHLLDQVQDEQSIYNVLKVYCKDKRQSSILHNGHIDISLIDSPGLNIDSMKTTSLFSKQQEIDVIVFVVNAENHFTLSGKEFLETATKEKAFVFIVVNRSDSIRRVERNQKEILEQIRTISPSTYGV